VQKPDARRKTMNWQIFESREKNTIWYGRNPEGRRVFALTNNLPSSHIVEPTAVHQVYYSLSALEEVTSALRVIVDSDN